MFNNLNKKILTLFGIGYIALMPGTFSSLFTCLFFSFLIMLKINLILIFFIYLILIPCVIILINKNLKLFSEIDAKEIVIDEFIGQSIPIFFVYFFINKLSNFNIDFDKLFLIKLMMVSFLTFRFFDIVKPYPINLIDKIKNGYGVVFDDVLAGIYSATITYIIFKFQII